jgi:hypothetical protein
LPTDYTAIMGQAGPGVVPDVDGLVQFLLQAGRDAAITSRGPHWSAITDEGIKPVAANLAQALRLAFPDLARSMEKSSPLVAGLAGLGLLIAPVLAYERYMVQNAKMAGANVPTSEPTN